jgi:hypothetical protein
VRQPVEFTVWQQKAANSSRGLSKQFCPIYIPPTVCLQIDSIPTGSENVQLLNLLEGLVILILLGFLTANSFCNISIDLKFLNKLQQSVEQEEGTHLCSVFIQFLVNGR